MAISRVQAHNSAASGTSASDTLTASPSEGNLLIAWVWSFAATEIVENTGTWSQGTSVVAGSGSTARASKMFWKIAGAGESATITCTVGSGNWRIDHIEYSNSNGWDLTNPRDVGDAQDNATVTPNFTPTVTPTQGIEALVVLGMAVRAANATFSAEQVNGSATGVVEELDGSGLALCTLIVASTSGSYQGQGTSSQPNATGAGCIGIFKGASGGTPATIEPALIASTGSIPTPTLSPGAVSLSPSRIASTASVSAAVLSPGVAAVAPLRIPSTSALFAPTFQPGSVVLHPSTIGGEAASPVKLAMFYHPPTGITAADAAGIYALSILTRGDETYRDAMKTAGFTGLNLQYIMGNEASGPEGAVIGSCGSYEFFPNNISGIQGDFCTELNPTESAFLHNSSGERLYGTFTWSDGTNLHDVFLYMMNPADATWQAYLAAGIQAQLADLGYDGVFLDNIGLSLFQLTNQAENADGTCAEYATTAAYRTAVAAGLAALKTALGSTVPIYANLISANDSASDYDQYAPYLDGAFYEFFVDRWSDTFVSETVWENQLEQAEGLFAEDKGYVMIAEGGAANEARMLFALGSYLLVVDDKAYFWYADNGDYGTPHLYAAYDSALGSPVGTRYQDGTVWKRDFQAGTVTVDPANHTATIDLVEPSGVTFFLPALQPGEVLLSPDLIESTGTIAVPDLLPGSTVLQPEHLASTETIFGPSVAPGSVSSPPAPTSTPSSTGRRPVRSSSGPNWHWRIHERSTTPSDASSGKRPRIFDV